MTSNLLFIGTGANGSIPPSSAPIRPKQTALEVCALRIQRIIQQAKLHVFDRDESLSAFRCPIGLSVAKDPVAIACGHVFEKTEIEAWGRAIRTATCPLCKAAITQLTPIHSLRDFTKERLSQDPILTCSEFKSSNPQRAAQCIELAKSCLEEKDHKGALGFLESALRYTNASTDYAVVSQVYDQMGSSEKALLSRFYLSLYQLQEGKVQEVVETLEGLSSSIPDLSALIVALTLQRHPSPEALKWAKSQAQNQSNLEDAIFIYQQILSYDPYQFDVHERLISLTQDPKEKKKLLLEAADLARAAGQLELEAVFRKRTEVALVPTAITTAEWANPSTMTLPPYPPELQEFLDGDCTIWPGKKRHETHIVVPLFPDMILDEGGTPIPFTLENLDQLDKRSGGTGYRDFWDEITKNEPAERKFRYAVMTRGVIPGSRNKSYDAQLRLLPEGYRMPGVFDAARAILWEARLSGTRCFTDEPWTYARCIEKIQGSRLIVGGFSASGLDVDLSYSAHKHVGVAGWRKF